MDSNTINRINALKARGKQYNNQRELLNAIIADRLLRQEIGEVYFLVFRKSVSGCSNCHADAFMELINATDEQIAEQAVQTFELKRGALLHDMVNLDASKMLSRNTLTNDLALYHLVTNPDCIIYFSQLPADWEQQADNYKAAMDAEAKKNSVQQQRIIAKDIRNIKRKMKIK